MSLISEIQLKAALGFLWAMLRRHQWRAATDFFFRVVVYDSLRAVLPTWVKRNWWLVLIAVAFLLAEVVLVLRTAPLQVLVSVAAHGDWRERLGLARLVTAALTFLLAIVGTTLALFEIRRALARPSLHVTFAGLSPHMATVFVPKQGASPDQPWSCGQIALRVWNLSDVIAHHFKLRLAFQDLGHFLVDVVEASGMPGRVWQRRRDLPGTQWEFRLEEPFKVYGQDVYEIGRIRLRLPADIAGALRTQFPRSHTIRIGAYIRDEWAGRQQTLELTLEPARSDSSAKGNPAT